MEVSSVYQPSVIARVYLGNDSQESWPAHAPPIRFNTAVEPNRSKITPLHVSSHGPHRNDSCRTGHRLCILHGRCCRSIAGLSAGLPRRHRQTKSRHYERPRIGVRLVLVEVSEPRLCCFLRCFAVTAHIHLVSFPIGGISFCETIAYLAANGQKYLLGDGRDCASFQIAFRAVCCLQFCQGICQRGAFIANKIAATNVQRKEYVSLR
jgi:hypothetical protein